MESKAKPELQIVKLKSQMESIKTRFLDEYQEMDVQETKEKDLVWNWCIKNGYKPTVGLVSYLGLGLLRIFGTLIKGDSPEPVKRRRTK